MSQSHSFFSKEWLKPVVYTNMKLGYFFLPTLSEHHLLNRHGSNVLIKMSMKHPQLENFVSRLLIIASEKMEFSISNFHKSCNFKKIRRYFMNIMFLHSNLNLHFCYVSLICIYLRSCFILPKSLLFIEAYSLYNAVSVFLTLDIKTYFNTQREWTTIHMVNF